jgi:predicted N-formylglutamate amidohydrolase
MKLIITCEHGGNLIPIAFQDKFLSAEDALNSHRGIDLGALDMFEYIKDLADFSVSYTWSRLLIELNRSLHHSNLFSEFSTSLSSEEKQILIQDYYLKYRNKVQAVIKKWLVDGEEVLHLSVHSFTPKLNGVIRNADIGLLYDPGRTKEKVFSRKLQAEIIHNMPALKVRFNYPYLGKADGFTTSLRKFYGENYSGIELEINQKFVTANKMDEAIKREIKNSLERLILN